MGDVVALGGGDPPDIVIGSPGMEHSGDTLRQRSLGGSETAAICIAEALAREGHTVRVFSPGGNGLHGPAQNPVTYLPVEQLVPWAQGNPHDVLVLSRNLPWLQVRNAAKSTYLWCHDLASKRTRQMLGSGLWQLDGLLVMSAFQRQQYLDVHLGLPPELVIQTRNGVWMKEISGVAADKRRPVLVYGSRPERGLEACLNIMDELRRTGVNLTLEVSFYDNVVPQMAPYYQALFDRAKTMPNVQVLGAQTQKQWRQRLATALAMIYPGCPGEFREISPVHGDTEVLTLQGPRRIADLVGQSGFHVYSRRPNGRLGYSRVNGVFMTRRHAEVITLRLRPGRGRNAKQETTLTLTPDHEVMRRDGTYIPAGQLRLGDRVMAVTGRQVGAYQRMGITGTEFRDAHRIVMESMLGRDLLRREVVHHRDGNGENNEPDNLRLMSQAEHRALHWGELSAEERASQNAARASTAQQIWNTPAGKASRRASANARWARRIASNHVVVGIDAAPPADVYCMEVEPDHNFVANGIVVHNCIAAIESMACGTPVVAVDRGAVPETLGAPEPAGVLVPWPDSGDPFQKPHTQRMCEAILTLAQDRDLWNECQRRGRQRALQYDWSVIAREWGEVFRGTLAARSGNPFRLRQHAVRMGDKELVAYLDAQTAGLPPLSA